MPVSFKRYMDIPAWMKPGSRDGLIDYELTSVLTEDGAELPAVDEVRHRDRAGHPKRYLRDRDLGREAQSLGLAHTEPQLRMRECPAPNSRHPVDVAHDVIAGIRIAHVYRGTYPTGVHS